MVCITYANYHATEQWYFSTTHISAVFIPIRKILESMNYTSFWMNVKCLKIYRNQSCVFDSLKARIKNLCGYSVVIPNEKWFPLMDAWRYRI